MVSNVLFGKKQFFVSITTYILQYHNDLYSRLYYVVS